MFVKIIAGVLAAVAVTGVGVYVSMPDSTCKSCCPLSRTEPAPLSTAEEAPGCCSLPRACTVPPAPNEGLAACTGAMSFVSATKAKPAHACCSDE